MEQTPIGPSIQISSPVDSIQMSSSIGSFNEYPIPDEDEQVNDRDEDFDDLNIRQSESDMEELPNFLSQPKSLELNSMQQDI